jgi:hypothetical protein
LDGQVPTVKVGKVGVGELRLGFGVWKTLLLLLLLYELGVVV